MAAMICETLTNSSPPKRNPTHCVFRHGPTWLALPATAVREVLPRPEMVAVPGTSREFVGLCHVRSEFIPVLNLNSVLPDSRQSGEHVMLILEDPDGPWALLVDQVTSLQPLEISDAPECDSAGPEAAIIGWATLNDTVIQVLDQSRIRQFAEYRLSCVWHSGTGVDRTGIVDGGEL